MRGGQLQGRECLSQQKYTTPHQRVVRYTQTVLNPRAQEYTHAMTDTEEKVLLQASLVFPVRNVASNTRGETVPTHVALGIKKKKIGAGLYNGVGGGIELGETPAESAVREAFEEWGVSLNKDALALRGVVDFHNIKSDGERFTCRVYVFISPPWQGEARESDEMGTPEWFAVDALPVDQMMLADRDWLPTLLASDSPIYAQCAYGPKQQTLERPSVVHLATLAELQTLLP